MNRFNDVFSGNRPFPSMDTMFKMNDVSPAVQTHLVQVYGALTATLLAASVGATVAELNDEPVDELAVAMQRLEPSG